MDACPAGWRLTGHVDWTELELYVCSHVGTDCYATFPYDSTTTGLRGTIEANALKSCRQEDSPLGGECNTSEHPYWVSSDHAYGTDEFGFSALPAGARTASAGGVYAGFGRYPYWWSSTEESSTTAWSRGMAYNHGIMRRTDINKSSGHAVRCIRN